MSLDTALIVLTLLLAPFSVVSTFILVDQARKPPRIGALTERAVIGVDIMAMVVSGTLITINRVNGFLLFPIDAARAIFLMSLIALEVVPVWWCFLAATHRLGGVTPTPEGTRLVLMSDPLFHELGATRVDWGEPDANGWYTPTLYSGPSA